MDSWSLNRPGCKLWTLRVLAVWLWADTFSSLSLSFLCLLNGYRMKWGHVRYHFYGSYIIFRYLPFLPPVHPAPASSVVPCPRGVSRGKGEEVFQSFWLLFPKSRRPYRDHGVAERRKEEDLWTETNCLWKAGKRMLTPEAQAEKIKNCSLVAPGHDADGASQNPCKNPHPQASHGSRGKLEPKAALSQGCWCLHDNRCAHIIEDTMCPSPPTCSQPRAYPWRCRT